MKGIQFQLQKTSSQIDTILFKPKLKLTLDIFYLNLTKFYIQALQIAQNIITQTNSQKNIQIQFQKLCRKLKQAKKYRPEHEEQQQDIYHQHQKDQITQFLNSRRPIKDNKNLTELNWYVEHMEKKQKDTEIFVQCMAKMKKNQTSKKIKTEDVSIQTQIRWVNSLEVSGLLTGLITTQVYQSIPQFKIYMDKQTEQMKNLKEQYKDILKKYQEMKQIHDKKINEIQSQIQVKPKLISHTKASNKKKKSSIINSTSTNNLKRNTISKQNRNSAHKQGLSGFGTPDMRPSQGNITQDCQVENNQKNYDNVKEIDYEIDLGQLKQNLKRRASRKLSEQNCKKDGASNHDIQAEKYRRRSSYSNQSSNQNKKVTQQTQLNQKNFAYQYRQIPFPTKISQQNSQLQTQSPRMVSQHKKTRSDVPQNTKILDKYSKSNLDQSELQTTSPKLQSSKSPFKKKSIQKSSFTYRDEPNTKIPQDPQIQKQSKQNTKIQRNSIKKTANLSNTKTKVHTVHRQSQISTLGGLTQVLKLKQNQNQIKDKSQNKQNRRQKQMNRSYHQQKMKIASVTANKFHSKLKNFIGTKQSFQNLPQIHNKNIKVHTHNSQSDQLEPLYLCQQDHQYIDYVNTLNTYPHSPSTYQQSTLQKKDNMIYNKITQLQAFPKQNQQKIQNYLNIVMKIHRKLCGKECKHLNRFYKQVHKNNWNNRIAIHLPTRKFGFFT